MQKRDEARKKWRETNTEGAPVAHGRALEKSQEVQGEARNGRRESHLLYSSAVRLHHVNQRLLNPNASILNLGAAHEIGRLAPEERSKRFTVRAGIHFRGVGCDGHVQVVHPDPPLAVAGYSVQMRAICSLDVVRTK